MAVRSVDGAKAALGWFTVQLLVGLVGCGNAQTSSGPLRDPTRDQVSERLVPRERVPKPLAGAADAVGGIESLTIAGKRYWFGFSYKADAVLSPLIDDRRVMAQFGSDYMLQTDGAHPPEYWDKLVVLATSESALSSKPGTSAFSGSEIRDLVQLVSEAKRTSAPVAGLHLPTDLSYLLDATSHWQSIAEGRDLNTVEKALAELGQGDLLDGALRVVAGKSAPPPETRLEDAIDIVSQHIAHWQRVVPENWLSLLVRN